MVQKLCKSSLVVVVGMAVVGMAVVVPWIWVADADGGHGSCQHNCRCSRLDFFDRLLPKSRARSGDALGTVQQTAGLLLADASTDWSEVKISRLREHLVDMNKIMMSAEADERPVRDGLEVTVRGDERTLEALRRVVPEHVRQLEGFRGWEISVEDTGEALDLLITSDNPADVEIVRGLGFFGLLSVGVHRPQTHLGIVRGKV